jgi:hypothetical protein
MSQALIYAYTQMQGPYPGYINLSDKCDTPLLIVRSPGHNGNQVAALPLAPKQLLELADAIVAKFRPKD